MALSWQYIAGFFDGEGTVSACASSQGRRLGAYIAQSGLKGLILLEEIKEFLGREGIKCSVFCTGRETQHKRTMPSYRLGVGGFGGVPIFLEKMLPFLRIKRTVAQDILRYNKMFPNLFKSPLTAAWRSEKQRANALRGNLWHKAYDGRKIGRPKGSKDTGPRKRARI